MCMAEVAVEEMLHLCLAGNILRGLGDGFLPILYLEKFVPIYPLNLPGRKPDLELHLSPLTKESLDTFVTVSRHFHLDSVLSSHSERCTA